MPKKNFKLGIETLLSSRKEWLAGKRVGLVSHLAAVNSKSQTTAELLWNDPEINMTCLFGPEHGFFGKAGPGEILKFSKHPDWNLPVHSLYGRGKKPTAAMLKDVDVLVYDIQDLAVRCYTYVSTLRYVLEAAAKYGKEVIIADRPVPLANIVDGPLTEEKFRSFVSLVDTPMCYGMTPGETALWLKNNLGLNLQLKIAEMNGYARQEFPEDGWPEWVPPSPAITWWPAGIWYPVTVFAESFSELEYGRGTLNPFRFIAAEWIDAEATVEILSSLKLPGVKFDSITCFAGHAKKTCGGISITVSLPLKYRPVKTAVSILYCLQKIHGKSKVWNKSTTRKKFFDQLFGTDAVRKALLDGDDPGAIAARWNEDLKKFNETRKRVLLYERRTTNEHE
ncbi:exo-beta-N-acetylmuramidase NamZ domain-containing protein [Verrucomicrobiota bacterium]